MKPRAMGKAVLRASVVALLLAFGAEARANEITYCDFSSIAGLKLNGNAAQQGASLRLTQDQIAQTSSFYATASPALAAMTSFATHFRFTMTPGANSGADGLAFLVQSAGGGPTALGLGGSGLGYQGISPSVAVEFDTFQNIWDPNANHVAIMQNGNQTNHLATGTPAFSLKSGAPIDAWIDYDAATKTMNVFVAMSATKPATPLITHAIDVFGTVGGAAFFGFTGATGGFSELELVDSWLLSTTTLTECPAPDGGADAGTDAGTDAGMDAGDDASTPDGSAPDAGAPDGSAPDGSAPDGSAPDGSAPDGSAPDGSAPDGSAPDAGTPDGGADGAVADAEVDDASGGDAAGSRDATTAGDADGGELDAEDAGVLEGSGCACDAGRSAGGARGALFTLALAVSLLVRRARRSARPRRGR